MNMRLEGRMSIKERKSVKDEGGKMYRVSTPEQALGKTNTFNTKPHPTPQINTQKKEMK